MNMYRETQNEIALPGEAWRKIGKVVVWILLAALAIAAFGMLSFGIATFYNAVGFNIAYCDVVGMESVPENATITETVDMTVTDKAVVSARGRGEQQYLYGITPDGTAVKYEVSDNVYAIAERGQTIQYVSYKVHDTSVGDMRGIGTAFLLSLVGALTIVFVRW